MAFKLIESAQARWRAVNAPHLIALARAEAHFVNGKLVDRPDDQDPPEEAEGLPAVPSPGSSSEACLRAVQART